MENIIITKEAAADLEVAVSKVSLLEKATGKAVFDRDFVLAKDLLNQYEDACLNIRLVMLAHDLPVPPLRCKVILPF